jgi:hypothetical protein
LKLGRAARKQLDELIAGAAPFTGDFFRSVAFQYFHPERVSSGEGTLFNGGRFVPVGAKAFYASLEEETAMRDVMARKRALVGRVEDAIALICHEADARNAHGGAVYTAMWMPAGVRAIGSLFHVRFPCESRDIPKCLSALAGFSHHSDSGQRTLEEIGHAVQVDIWAQFTLTLCSGEHTDQRLTLCPPSLLDNSSHVSVPVVELADCIHSHTTFSAGQVISLGEANECISQGGESGARLFQFHIDGVNTLSDVHLERFQEQLPLIAKGVIHALSADLHDAHQFIGGRGGKALLTKQAYGFSKCLVLIELLRTSHSPSIWASSLSIMRRNRRRW